MDTKPVITPKTKVHDLLENYPELEQVLVELAPAFRKLRNPVLRKTVARVTTLSQAAAIGNIHVEKLVNTLRKEAGFQELSGESGDGPGYRYEAPDWHGKNRIAEILDIDPMLEAGDQPLGEALAAANRLKPGETLEVIAPFLPAPLIDKAGSLGFDHWIREEEGRFHVFIALNTV